MLALYGTPGMAFAYNGNYTYTGGATYDFWWVLVNQTNEEISGNVKVTSRGYSNVYGDLNLNSLNPGETTPYPSPTTGFRGPWFSSDASITTWLVTVQDTHGGPKKTAPWSDTACPEGFDVHRADFNASYLKPVQVAVTYSGDPARDPYNYNLVISMPASGQSCTIPFK
jgi:hypothetical protein